MESNMITALYLIMIAVRVAKGRGSPGHSSGNNGMNGGNNGLGNVDRAVVTFRPNSSVDGSKPYGVNQAVEKESQMHHTVYG